jgi:hypothetical protein
MSMTEKEVNFKRLAEKRMESAIKTLRLIGNLSNRSNYSYSLADVEKIISTLKSEVSLLESQFKIRQLRERDKFRL